MASHGKPLKPVHHHDKSLYVSKNVHCPLCNAPSKYLYFNNGAKKSQIRCKVCSNLFQQTKKTFPKSKLFCPHCHNALFVWKHLKDLIIHKCCNDNCPHRLSALNKLNPIEKLIRTKLLPHFKLNYQYREYLFKPSDLKLSSPDKPSINLSKSYNSINIIALVLSFYVSFAMSARKTALILYMVFNIKLSHQTVLNYASSAAHYCHIFNLKNKGPIDDISAGDEAYIKILGKHFYTFLFISSKYRKISSYHLSDTRDTKPAIIAMQEAIRTASNDQNITLVTDSNPSYPAGIHFINSNSHSTLIHRKVTGLQNLDSESTVFRPFKQLIERLMRTFKHHVKPAAGFNSFNGALALIILFVTHYNFLRPHMSLDYNVPVPLEELQNISTIQGKWAKIISLAS